jgi:hypothetical protein
LLLLLLTKQELLLLVTKKLQLGRGGLLSRGRKNCRGGRRRWWRPCVRCYARRSG